MNTTTEILTVTNVTRDMINFTDPTTCVPVGYLPDAKRGDVVCVVVDADTNTFVSVERVSK